MKKIFGLVLCLLLFVSNILLISGCGCSRRNDGEHNNTDDILLQYFDSTMLEGTVEFTHSIMDFEDFYRITPLGVINPPGHTFPTDHIYFITTAREMEKDESNEYIFIGHPIYAPTSGKILFIQESGLYGDGAIRIALTNTMTCYLAHIFVNETIKVGDMVEAGEQIAVSGNTSAVDFGLINKNIDNGFLNPKKTPLTTLYGDKPLSYYAEPLRTQLYQFVKPNVEDDPDYEIGTVTDGDFALDKFGSLCGNWYEEGRTDGLYEWEETLSFGYDVFYSDQIRIGSGKYGNAFAIKNTDNPIRPENFSTSSGVIAYYIYNANNTSKGVPFSARTGLMMIQMLSDTRLKLEIFNDTTSESRAFTSAALYYQR